jgi:hypothetical protein
MRVAGSDADRSGVGETALGAAMRAEEGERADRLFEDPFAAAFLAAAPDPFPDGPDPDDPQIAELKDAFQTNVAVRTRFFDDFLRSVCAGGCEQVVLLAEGSDVQPALAWWWFSYLSQSALVVVAMVLAGVFSPGVGAWTLIPLAGLALTYCVTGRAVAAGILSSHHRELAARRLTMT